VNPPKQSKTKMSVSRINELTELIARYEEYYKAPEIPNQLCRTPNMTQMAQYKQWRYEREMLEVDLLEKTIARVREEEDTEAEIKMYMLAGMIYRGDRSSFYCKPFADIRSANVHLGYLKAKYPDMNTSLLTIISGDESDKSLEIFYNL